jgi:DNA-binding transcriptional MerR regulator
VALYLIRSVADQVGLAPETVRAYCNEGLVTPLRDSSGRRLFTDHDVRRIREVCLAKMARRPLYARAREEAVA